MNKIKILLVEDDLFLRDIFLETLQSISEYEVVDAADGKTAYEELRKGGWDLVLLDVLLPVYSGVEVLKKIKKDKIPRPAKRIVFMTNSDDKGEIEDVLDMADDYWMKSSFNPEQLLEKVKSALA